MNQPSNSLPPIQGFDAKITLDGGVDGEMKILGLWSAATSEASAAEANFALKAQQMSQALYSQEAASIDTDIKDMSAQAAKGQSGQVQAQVDQAKIQSLQSAVGALTQVASSARDDATNKLQALSENDLITAAMDPNNKVASLVTSLGPAI